MNFIGIAIACAFVFAGIYAGQKDNGNIDRIWGTPEVTREVLSKEETVSNESLVETVDQSPTDTPTNTLTPKPSFTISPTVKPSSPPQSNGTTNNTSVKVYARNGVRYAEVNGTEVTLDANGCYDYSKDGTKIHACVNN